jgi:hypothetical protein
MERLPKPIDELGPEDLPEELPKTVEEAFGKMDLIIEDKEISRTFYFLGQARDVRSLGIAEKNRQANLGFASVVHDRLMIQIADFEKDLNSDEELGGYFASFERKLLVRISDIGYHNPYFIVFHGEELGSGRRVQLVQHVSPISVLLRAVPKLAEHKQPKRLGFQHITPDK